MPIHTEAASCGVNPAIHRVVVLAGEAQLRGFRLRRDRAAAQRQAVAVGDAEHRLGHVARDLLGEALLTVRSRPVQHPPVGGDDLRDQVRRVPHPAARDGGVRRGQLERADLLVAQSDALVRVVEWRT